MIRFGIIGTNWITERFIQAANEIEDFALTAVYSRTEERAKEFAAKFNVPATFTDLESMAMSDEIDAVYIASPNCFHAEQAIMYMNHGKHVLCEKPMASNKEEVKAMIDAARKNNVLLMEALKTTLLPNFKSIQNHLYKIGTVRRYAASYCQYSSRYDAYKKGTVLNAFNPAFSNGSLMDIGVYCIYPMVVLFGKPHTVKATGMLLDSGADGEGSILFQYEDKDAVVMYSKITNSYLPAEIQGEDGSIIIDKIHTPEKVEIRYNDGRVEDITEPQASNAMYYETKEFIELIQNGNFESSINSYANSLITAELMDEARKQIGLVFPADEGCNL
ncbi:putative dehydrogenase [Bacillus fengqiuensis]|nr:putative dehydrogenase [Bacillus fengqiuensis]